MVENCFTRLWMLCWFLVPQPYLSFFFFWTFGEHPVHSSGSCLTLQFLDVPMLARDARFHAFFTGVNCFVVWPYFIVFIQLANNRHPEALLGFGSQEKQWMPHSHTQLMVCFYLRFSRGHIQQCNYWINSTRHCQTISRRPENSWHSYPCQHLIWSGFLIFDYLEHGARLFLIFVNVISLRN